MSGRHKLTLALAIVVAGLCYLPGLSGPFWLDDHQNLEPLRLWQDGVLLWHGVVFGNESGPLGRPLAMATFLFNAATTGLGSPGFKITNLLIHLACGVLVAGLARRIVQLDPRLRPHAAWLAVPVAAWWLLLPIHTETVLYVIQRMAQLSALFIFAGLWLYLVARERIETGQRSGPWLMFLGVPVMTILGALSKENALLLPSLCLVLEISLFAHSHRPRPVKWFLGLIVAAPAALSLMLVVLDPGIVTGGYADRDFTLAERVLTQGRVLWGYVGTILLPSPSALSVFQDDVTVSRGLLAPATTLLSILAWAAALIAAWLVRRSSPLILTGLLLFLGGHLMESSVFSLELAFLHRNYMPSLGILLAVTGVVALLAQRMPALTPEFRKISLGLLLVVLAALWTMTHARAWAWQSEAALVNSELQSNPESVRAWTSAAQLSVRAGSPDVAMRQIQEAEKHLAANEAGTAPIWRMMVYCGSNRPIPPGLVETFRSKGDAAITHYERMAFDELTGHLENARCPIDNLERIADAATGWLDSTSQKPTNQNVWRFRYNTARLLARSGNLERAFPLASQAFRDSGWEFPIGVFTFTLATSLERFPEAREILDTLKAVRNDADLRHERTIRQFERFLDRESPDDSMGESRGTSDL